MHVMMATLFTLSQVTVAVVPTKAGLLELVSVVLGGRSTGRLHVTEMTHQLIYSSQTRLHAHHNVVELWLLNCVYIQLQH